MAETSKDGKEGENIKTFQRNKHWGNCLDLVDQEKKLFKVGSKDFNLADQVPRSLSVCVCELHFLPRLEFELIALGW